MDALDAIRNRHSSRTFKPAPIGGEVLEKIVDAGRWAATARNIQPWEFVVVTQRTSLEQIAAITDHGKFIAGCEACVAVFCADTKYYLEDGSAATQNILVAATALGVDSCWVAGDKKAYAPQINQLLGAPAHLKLVSIVALGIKDENRLRPPKRPLNEVLHWERYRVPSRQVS